VIQGKSSDDGGNNSAGGIMTTEKLRILLDQEPDIPG